MPELIEALKLAAQLCFAIAAQAGLDEQQQVEFLNEQRDEFKKLRSEPLPDV